MGELKRKWSINGVNLRDGFCKRQFDAVKIGNKFPALRIKTGKSIVQVVLERSFHCCLWGLRDVFIRLYSPVRKHLRSELLHVVVVVEINCAN